MTALLLLCYFSHIVAIVLALFSLGVLWIAALPAAVREKPVAGGTCGIR